MRDDMDRLMVLRPRWGSDDPWRGRRRRLRNAHRVEEAPRGESIRMGKQKSLSENFAPLVRFLRSRLGRPWNQVYSELRTVLRPDSAVKEHVYVHLREYVSTNVFLQGGVLYDGDRGGQPLRDSWGYQFYVCPRSGKLMEIRKARPRKRPAKNRSIRVASATLQYHKIDELWFEIRLEKVPGSPEGRRAAFECLVRAPLHNVSAEMLSSLYGTADYYAARKRQVSSREIRELRKLPSAKWASGKRAGTKA